MKRSPIPRENRERREARFKSAFGGGKADWIREQECMIHRFFCCNSGREVADALDCDGLIQAAHVSHARGAMGDATALAPLCRKHHEESHSQGPFTTAKKYGVNWALAADLYDALWTIHIQEDAA